MPGSAIDHGKTCILGLFDKLLMHRSSELTVSNIWQRLELSLRFGKMHWGEVLIKYLLLLLQDLIREARARNGLESNSLGHQLTIKI